MKHNSVRLNVIMALCLSVIAIILAVNRGYADPATISKSDALSVGFRTPPDSARPRVWWHWMNGNITKDGIAKDLEWMKRVGIGGVQNFDAAKNTPQIVDKRLAYMSPEWQDAFRYAVQLADQLGLEFGIASSPGWSETGGPWVEPKDAMKKLVWSEMTLKGGKRFKGQLPAPPSVAGLYQNIPLGVQPKPIPGFYRDSVVLAYRDDVVDELPMPGATVNGKPVDAAILLDGDPTTSIPLPASVNGSPGVLQYSYTKPHTMRSAHVYIHNFSVGNPFAAPLILRLEASDDTDTWRHIADIRVTNVPSTASFAPATARHFRLVFTRGAPRKLVGIAAIPGVDPLAAKATGAVAAPAPTMASFELSIRTSVNAFEQKAGFAIAESYDSIDDPVDLATGIAPDAVLDITNRFSSDGELDWTPPVGRWKILRFGYSLTGKTNAPATAEATGLEVDKYDGVAVEHYLNTYFGMYRNAVGAALFGAKGVNCLVNDSIEAGPSNWTPRILDQFKRLRGYDARPWLPALAGKLVGTRGQSDAFLYDFRRTLSDLMAAEHYGTIAKVAHEQGLTVYGESLEGTRATLGDDIEMRKYADIPMAALWAFKQAPRANLVADLRGAASTAHIYGRPLVAAESLTSVMAPWAFSPADLQPMIDMEFANGVNRPVIHTSVHQPLDKQPGLSLEIYGQYFTRHETWAEMAKPWVDYIARNSYMLQQGRNVADVAYFYGEDTPIGAQVHSEYLSDVSTRYAYDFLSPGALLNDLSVQGTEIVTNGGARYKAIYLGGQSTYMTGAVLRRLAELADAGATIIGPRPEHVLSLNDNSREFSQLVQRLWSGASSTNVGKGRVIDTKNIEEALASIGVPPDFSYTSTVNDGQVLFVHRQLTEGDIYFVTNRLDRAEHIEARFRVSGKLPEIWHADTGKSTRVSYRIEGDETIVPLDMGPQESLFVVFRESTSAPFATIPKATVVTLAEINGPWSVTFQSGRGAPETLQLDALSSLSDAKDPGIKYFSGVATYKNSFVISKGMKVGSSLVIDLGRVGDIAEVTVNGTLVGTAWKPPYQVDIGTLVRRGRNELEIRVANLWVNRLIGDAQPGAKAIAFTTLPTYTAKAPLRPSGLIGPVLLMQPQN